MFFEFCTMDLDDGFILMGYDGPRDPDVASDRPCPACLEVQHGNSGHGGGIDFNAQQGIITLLNLVQFDAGDTFKVICPLAEAFPGLSRAVGDPNCRVRLSVPIHESVDDWRRQARSHHIALGVGGRSGGLEVLGEAMGFGAIRV